ncbi:probable 2-oxoglutarate-dependent dioxygenase ANS [Carica papaya]|uniref:probable 2-oxoglutarate-dependent dioxygenase ANS n=1 Tax=Carica papaya TaxID=3649 RepID=UPI000B8C7331|nr:probable 2-oxoglutarate-dependent dioxygenase ANS [Carica papaya]
MAGAAEILLSKRVQEMVLNGEQPPELYISRDGSEGVDVCSASTPVPIVDISFFSSSVPSDVQGEELQKLRSILSTWGCFQAIGHGIPTSFLDEVRQVGREFFEQPMGEKKKYAKGVNEFAGYGADPVPEEGQFLDWSDRLFLDVYPEDLKQAIYWPENPKSFRKILEEYTVKIRKVTEVISRGMAKSLQLQENCFLDHFGERATLQARFNYYSCCQRPEVVLGLKPHSDSSGYTLILQDDVQGLQILKHQQWVTVPTISNAILVLMGDQMQIMTNGIFKSPVHRVLSNSTRERLSVAMFYTPEPDKDIGPEDSLIREDKPRLFKKVRNYASTHLEYYQRGMRAIHVAEI